MPVILKKESRGGQHIGVWEITEEEGWFLQKVQLSTDEVNFHLSLKSEQRRLEWLAVRALLAEMMNWAGIPITLGSHQHIVYEKNGKPRLNANRAKLSISHSGNYVAVALNPKFDTGIDIELIHPRLNNIAARFLHESEKSYLRQETMPEQLCVIWCCKEALYKLHSGSRLNFSQNIIISPFELSENGAVTGRIILGEEVTVCPMSFTRLNAYMLVHTNVQEF